ncbi:MAG: hypothetical protein K6E98_06275 [Lachnospiraceae bacterium]|nr:hypothetical protein [Lachnospiraceae bacterium]
MRLFDIIKEKLGFDDDDDELDFGDGMTFDEYEEEMEDVEKITDGLKRAPLKRNDINILDYRERELYIRNKCEQMKAASEDLEGQKHEYERVTQQLADLDEIGALTLTRFSELVRLAKRIENIEEEEKKYKRPLSKITESQYRDMASKEKEIPKIIKKMQDEENHQMSIKRDLNLLEGEKAALAYQRREERRKAANSKAWVVVCSLVSVLAAALLFILQSALGFDVRIGYYIIIAFFCLSLTGVFVSFKNAQDAQVSAEKKINRAITLQNSVKIKYVNATNLIDFYYSKYNVNNSYELNYMWEKYQEEKAARKHTDEVAARIEKARKDLIDELRNYKLNDPATFVYRTELLTDEDVMQDVRRKLIIQRKKLKQGMDFNNYSLDMAKQAIESVVTEYPKFAKEVLAIVDQYE